MILKKNALNFLFCRALYILTRRSHVGVGGATVSTVLVCAQVTHLVIKRPQFFHFKPGDYVYINIPAIAKYEWHPFTISSAPEQSGTTTTATTAR